MEHRDGVRFDVDQARVDRIREDTPSTEAFALGITYKVTIFP